MVYDYIRQWQHNFRRTDLELCAGRAAPPPPPTICGRRRRRLLLIGAPPPPPIPFLLSSYFLEFLMTSSLSSLPSGRSRPPMVSCFSMLSFFFKFAVFLAHHPVQ